MTPVVPQQRSTRPRVRQTRAHDSLADDRAAYDTGLLTRSTSPRAAAGGHESGLGRGGAGPTSQPTGLLRRLGDDSPAVGLSSPPNVLQEDAVAPCCGSVSESVTCAEPAPPAALVALGCRGGAFHGA